MLGYATIASHLNCAADSRKNYINSSAAQVVSVEIGMLAVDGDEDFGLYASSDFKQVRAAGVAGGM
jgi:hypothetical protein